jgi:ferredoxin-NADP reductase
VDLNGERFEYLPGQAVLVATHGREKRRPYSLASSPEHVRREGWIELLVGVDADGVVGPHLTLERGSEVDVEGPLGNFTFPPHPEESRFVFIAGGTGISPLRAMLYHALAIPHEQIGLFYSARTPEDFAYEEEFRALARTGRIELRQAVTRAANIEDWTGTRGRLGRSELQPLVHGPATLCFLCGPPALVDGMSALLQELGVPPARIKIEEW